MIPFLKQVAEHYLRQGAMDRLCFIFPNRRSMTFFHSKWLVDAVRAIGKPIVSPQMFTMNDFFCRVSGVCVTDRVSLLLTLHECYRALNEHAEPLDDFIFWGDMILADFDDTDKYLASPEKLFANVADFKKMQDDMSYLTDTQQEALKRFMTHFRSRDGMTVDAVHDSPDAKERFLSMWNLMSPLYRKFRNVLESRNMAYEGMAYRKFAERLTEESVADILKEAFPVTDKFVFVGLNALNECERKVMGKMRDASLAEFCWDFTSYMVRDCQNRSSMFMSKNVSDFPQAFELDPEYGRSSVAEDIGHADTCPDIKVISVPSSTGQVKCLPKILEDIKVETPADWSETAIVLPDESLLIPVLNSIPPEIGAVNVTMGCQMSGSGIYALMNQVMALQVHQRIRDGECSFYYRQVWQILASGVVRAVMGADAVALAARIKKEARLYVSQAEFTDVWPFNTIFKPVLKDPGLAEDSQIKEMEKYQLEILDEIGAKLSGIGAMSLEMNFAKQYHLCVNRMKALTLNILPATYMHLLQQLVGMVTVPFKGEPLNGLQIMGPLESRSLDFTNLIILSCNEGVFPRHNVSSSFIPPELRKGFGLPTYENQDAVWAYYFYRMIQRPEHVWLVYDSRSEGLKSGEESRYIKQLEYLYRYHRLTRYVLRSKVDVNSEETSVPKDDAALECIRSMTFSASVLRKYLSCPAMFYYSSVLKLKSESEVAESMDGSMIGNVFHNTMYALYTGGDALRSDFDMSRENVRAKIKNPLKTVSEEYLRWLISDGGIIRNKVRTLIKAELNADEVIGRNLVLENVINRYIRKTLECDLNLMKEKSVKQFSIIGLEMEWYWEFAGFRFHGFVDRMDSFTPGTVRIVDYKTGRVEDNDVNIDEGNAEAVAEMLFGKDVRKRPDIALQLYLYDRFVHDGTSHDGVSPLKMSGVVPTIENVLYPIPKLFSSGVLAAPECRKFDEAVTDKLSGLMSEISDPEIGFRRTGETSTCSYCDFRKICGR